MIADSDFPFSAPAQNIHELLSYLQATHLDADMYRGQTRHYPALIPSGCRSAMIRETESERIVALDGKRLAAENERHAARRQFHGLLVKELGRGIGDVVAQQYGVNSECLDFTTDLDRAAFFATHPWPSYEAVMPKGIGVIYRYRFPSSFPAPLTGHRLSDWFDTAVGESPRCEGVWFRHFRYEHEHGGLFDRDILALPWLTESTAVKTPHTALRWIDVRGLFEEVKEKLLWSGTAPFENTRVARQMGGLILPSFHWQAGIHPSLKILDEPPPSRARRDESGLLAAWAGSHRDDIPPWPRAWPEIALRKKLVGVENLNRHPGIRAYFFEHGADYVPQLARFELWPDSMQDLLFDRLRMKALAFFIDDDVVMEAGTEHPSSGILDLGYHVSEFTTWENEGWERAKGVIADMCRRLASGRADVGTFRALAGAQFQLGALAEADLSISRALEFDPTDVAAWNTRGILCHQTDRFAEAELAFREAIARGPQEIEHYFNLAMVLRDLRRYDEAERLLLKSWEKAADTDRMRACGLDWDVLIGHLAVIAALNRGIAAAEPWLQRYEDRGRSREELLAAIREHQEDE